MVGSKVLVAAAGVLVLVGSARLASAQAGGAPQGQAGGAAAGQRPSLNLLISLVEAYDSNLQGGVASVTPNLFQQSGSHTSLSPTMTFASRGRSLTATGGATVRYYSGQNRLVTLGHNVGAGFSTQLTRTTSFSVNQGVAYAPAYLYGLFTSTGPTTPGGVSNTSSYVVNGQASYRYTTGANLSRRVSPRDTLSINSSFRYTDFIGSTPGASDLVAYDVGGRFTHQITRDGGVRLGYAYRQAAWQAASGSPLQTISHDVDTGIDYRWPLSAARRTTLGFNVGTAVVNGPAPADPARARWQVRLVGDASLNHQMGRTWQLRGAFHRGVGFIEGIEGPAVSDSVTVSTNGSMSRRTAMTASVAYAKGSATNASGTPTNFDTYTGNAEVSFAISRTWATYMEYQYYLYDFGQGLQMSGVALNNERHSVRAGLTLSLSLIGR